MKYVFACSVVVIFCIVVAVVDTVVVDIIVSSVVEQLQVVGTVVGVGVGDVRASELNKFVVRPKDIYCSLLITK